MDFKSGVTVVSTTKPILGRVRFCKFKIEEDSLLLRCLLKTNKTERQAVLGYLNKNCKVQHNNNMSARNFQPFIAVFAAGCLGKEPTIQMLLAEERLA